MVIRDGFPISPGHTLIIPKRHVGSFFETSTDEQTSILDLLHEAQELITKDLNPDGFNIGINDGAAAGQTVLHMHLHLIPRFTGDVPDPRGGIRWVLPHTARYWSE